MCWAQISFSLPWDRFYKSLDQEGWATYFWNIFPKLVCWWWEHCLSLISSDFEYHNILFTSFCLIVSCRAAARKHRHSLFLHIFIQVFPLICYPHYNCSGGQTILRLISQLTAAASTNMTTVADRFEICDV